MPQWRGYIMIKKLTIIMSAMAIPVLLNGMDLKLKELKRTVTNDKGSESREVGDKRPDIRLNLGNIQEEPVLSDLHGKPSITSLKQVHHLKTQQNTFRDASTGRGGSDGQREKSMFVDLNDQNKANNTTILKSDDDKEENILESNGLRKCSNSVKKTRSVLGEFSSNKTFSSQDMWDLLKKTNPKLYDYAQENQLSLDEVKRCPYDFDAINPQIYNLLNQLSKKKSLPLNIMMEYAHLSENNNIDPEGIGQLLQLYHGYSDDFTAELVGKYKELAKKNEDQYSGVALDFITRTCDEGGLKELSPLNKTHAAIQKGMISDQRRKFWYSVIGNVAAFLGFTGAAVWGIYGQVTHATAPTNAPTFMPSSPTESPI